ncbi:MAG: tyrosine-type recombinase/integrase [Bacteroidetes bacterium]|jgi:hypothetical protein|nr:tyrosine-type recombinase/integrase [Bacteroidota bacterium]
MATFKAEIYKHQKKANGTWNVKIRITHNREKKYLSTSIYVMLNYNLFWLWIIYVLFFNNHYVHSYLN